MTIAVLLATYNGEQFLSAQLESLLRQTYTDFTIYVSDDFSTDSTNEIIKEYSEKYPTKIINLPNKYRFGNARDNFLSLINRVDADCYLFCDQDDVWNSEKMEILCNEYQKHPKDIPTLIYSDLTVVDKNLCIINSSFISMMNLSKDTTWKKLLIQNSITGCTLLINKPLADLYKSNINTIINENIIMHDHFFALLASIFGKIYFIDRPLIKYRQHETNSVGAKNVKAFSYIIQKIKKIQDGKNLIKQTEVQAGELLKTFPETMKNNIIYSTIESYYHLTSKPKLYKCIFLIKNNLLKNSFGRIIFQFLTI